jgi:hypothetical protein
VEGRTLVLKVFVTGWSSRSNGRFDYATLAYDLATGAQVWEERYNGPVNGDDFAKSLGVSPDGLKVFVSNPGR